MLRTDLFRKVKERRFSAATVALKSLGFSPGLVVLAFARLFVVTKDQEEADLLVFLPTDLNYHVTACVKICMLAPSLVSDHAACTTPSGPLTNCV
jgi:hypothetical protein